MSSHGLYRVVGKRPYRGHEPGTEFEARLDRNAERRAVARGDITLLQIVTPELQEGSYTLPQGWAEPPLATPQTEAPHGASLVSGGG